LNDSTTVSASLLVRVSHFQRAISRSLSIPRDWLVAFCQLRISVASGGFVEPKWSYPSLFQVTPFLFVPQSSGFYPPHCYQVSLALSHWHIRESLTLFSFDTRGSPLMSQFYGPIGTFCDQISRVSRGKTHHLPISRPTSVCFGCCASDFGTRSAMSARPPPHTHLVGLLFATYTGSTSCFLQIPITGFTLALLALSFRPTGGLSQRMRHARRTFGCGPRPR
jgi:hypothetical protein